jgi:hypothetical protein
VALACGWLEWLAGSEAAEGSEEAAGGGREVVAGVCVKVRRPESVRELPRLS